MATWSLNSNHLSAQSVDAYEHYVRTSIDFQTVKQDGDWARKAFPSWTFMPWTHDWGIGYTDKSGQWCLEHGGNTAFIDHGGINTKESKTGRLDWIEKFNLRFYVDHAAGKGILHLWDGNKVKPHLEELHGVGVRPVPLNEVTESQLKSILEKNLRSV